MPRSNPLKAQVLGMMFEENWLTICKEGEVILEFSDVGLSSSASQYSDPTKTQSKCELHKMDTPLKVQHAFSTAC